MWRSGVRQRCQLVGGLSAPQFFSQAASYHGFDKLAAYRTFSEQDLQDAQDEPKSPVNIASASILFILSILSIPAWLTYLT